MSDSIPSTRIYISKPSETSSISKMSDKSSKPRHKWHKCPRSSTNQKSLVVHTKTSSIPKAVKPHFSSTIILSNTITTAATRSSFQQSENSNPIAKLHMEMMILGFLGETNGKSRNVAKNYLIKQKWKMQEAIKAYNNDVVCNDVLKKGSSSTSSLSSQQQQQQKIIDCYEESYYDCYGESYYDSYGEYY